MPFAFENLHVYQKAVTFADAVCTITRELPRGYFFLADQLNRASLSIAANIAEGNGRFTKGERRNFFGIARGSLHECVPLLELAARQGVLKSDRHTELNADLEEVARTRRRSSSPYLSIDMPRRRSLIAGEICIGAGPLGSEIDSKSGISKRFTKSTCFSRRVE